MSKPAQQEMPERILHKQRLRNICSWTLYRVCDVGLSWKAVIFLCTIGVVVFIFIGRIGSFATGLLLFTLRRYFRIRRHDVLCNTKEMFSHHFLAVNPGFNEMKWNDVASKMNTDLYAQSCWRARNFFSTGDECHSSFREYVLKPSLTPVSAVSRDAIERYKQEVSQLYERLLQEEFPSNPKFLPGSESYARFKLLISNKSFLKSILSGLFLLVWSLMIDISVLTIWICYRKVIGISNAYELHLKGKYKNLGITQRVKFLATIMHFAPRYDLEKWDHIASHMNWYLHTEAIWTGADENFVDGKECLNFYESEFIFLASKSDSSNFPDLKEIVSETNKVCAPF